MRLFSYQGSFLQILYSPFDGTAGQGQICGYGFDTRPRFFLFIHPVVKVDIYELRPMRQLGLIALKNTASEHLLIPCAQALVLLPVVPRGLSPVLL